MFNKFIKLHLALFTLLFIFAQENALANTDSQENVSTIAVNDIIVQSDKSLTNVLIRTTPKASNIESKKIDGTQNAPARMYIDIKNAQISGAQSEYYVGTVLDKIRVASNDNGVRIVFDSSTATLFDYTIDTVNNGINVIIKNNQPQPVEQATTDNTLDELIESSVAEIENQPVTDEKQDGEVTSVEDSFKISGFNKERISVDFYKIDLHNVFRLFREISGLNIIVDEKVNGTLTLSLNDVPWDFALDIVLNLSDLKKEERFNTIVIYPKNEEFTWPERTSLDNLEIDTDLSILEQQTLIVQQAANQSKEMMLAQEALKKAKGAETRNDYEDAAVYYEEALNLWPDNDKISNRLATLYLVELRQNAKAVFHAKKALEENPENYKAALYAAIGSANMQKDDDAMEFFTQSVSGSTPMQEALISFAAFSENKKKFKDALTLLNKHSDFYGDTATTMLSKARIFDNMGAKDQATEQYKALLTSGFQLRPDLKKFINERIAAETSN